MTHAQSCKVCRFFNKKNEYGGQCRRFPPVVFLEPVDNQSNQVFFANTAQPWVNDDWCGEFRALTARAKGDTP